MKMDTAIEILAEMHDAADGPRAETLALALDALEDARDRHEAEVDEAERMLPRDVIDEVERRLGLAREEGPR